jgi:hypothetical protein
MSDPSLPCLEATHHKVRSGRVNHTVRMVKSVQHRGALPFMTPKAAGAVSLRELLLTRLATR